MLELLQAIRQLRNRILAVVTSAIRRLVLCSSISRNQCMFCILGHPGEIMLAPFFANPNYAPKESCR